ncbi:hypothetical protein ABIF07_006537 [Bradyrhizobium elkanii]|uniref:hypothetical protein n=1 Tax=Bradyrhizobium elkanii TaxID=29448 RepID=UPI003516D0B1
MKRNEKTCSISSSVAAGLLAVAILAGAAIPVMAQQFSADLVANKDDAAAAMGALRVSGAKARIETSALPDGFFLIDTRKPAAYFVPSGGTGLHGRAAIEPAHPDVHSGRSG